jgi:hypothetical protein
MVLRKQNEAIDLKGHNFMPFLLGNGLYRFQFGTVEMMATIYES